MKKLLPSFLTLLAIVGLQTSASAQPNTAYGALEAVNSINYYDYKKALDAYVAPVPESADDFRSKFERNNFILEPRLYPSGKDLNITAKILEAKLSYEAELRDKNPNYAQTETTTGSWSSYGGTIDNFVGRVDRIAFHPTNSNTFWAGSAGGGLWKTTNGGSSWFSLTDDLGQLGISGLAVHPTNPNIIYIGTAEYQSSYGGSRGSLGILKTTDGGSTWYGTDLSFQRVDDERILDLIIHPTNGNILIASTTDGIYRTTTGGTSFTKVSTATDALDLEWKPSDPTIVYAAGNNEIYRSTTTGSSFTRIAPASFPNGTWHGAIGVSPANPDYLYVIFADTMNQGIFRSFDSGLNFGAKETADLIGRQGWYTLELAVSNNSVARVTTGGLVCNTSGSYANPGTFTSSFAGAHVDIQELKYQPGTDELFMGSDGGLFKSSDHGANWTNITGNMRITQYYRMSGSNASSSRIFAGAQDNSNHLINSSSTATLKDCCDGMDNAMDQNNANIIYYSAQRSVFFLSTNGASSKIDISDTSLWTPWAGGNPWISPIRIDPGTNNLAYFGVRDVLQYTRSSNSWISKNHPGGNTIRAMVQGISWRNRFYTIDGGNIIRRSDNFLNANPTWTVRMNGLPSGVAFTELTVNSNNSLEVWVTASGFVAGNKVFHSTDGGNNWTNISGSLPNVPANVIKFHDNGLNNDALYIGTDLGVFYRNNTIGDWVWFNNYMPAAIVTDLFINENSNKVFASTYGRGIWSSDVFGACPNDYNFFNFLGIVTGGTKYFQASDHIDSYREYKASSATNINYEAGNYINLTPGFWLKSTSKFEGKIGPCHTNLTTPVQNKYPGKYMGLLPSINVKSDKILEAGK